MDEDANGDERTPAELGRGDEEESALGQEREGALEPSPGVVRPDEPDG